MKLLNPLWLYLFALIMAVSCSSQTTKIERQINESSPPASAKPSDILEKFWQIAKANIYPKELEQKYFTQSEYNKLSALAKNNTNFYEFSVHLNNFLKRLGVSHTHFYTDQDVEYYFFRSLFSTRDPDKPSIGHIGADYEKTERGYFVRSVLDGYSAQKSGLRRGDLIIEADGKPFNPTSSFSNSTTNQEVKISIQRNLRTLQVTVSPATMGLHRAYIDAIPKSVKVIAVKNKKIGYVHLWTGTHDDTVKALQQSVNQLKNTDALVLDLRDGYGGAWWDHLDPFFSDTQNYFKATWIDRDGKTTEKLPEFKKNPNPYLKPMVVLINEGVRSGKEALAFQFKKTKRATLIGTQTAGFFVAGGAHFREPELPYFLYLSSKGLLLDGVNLEGNGVIPDIYVAYPLSSEFKTDPQLEEAVKILAK